MNWVRGNSMFMLQFGIACCSIEMIHTYAIKHDVDRYGAGVPRASPRQADVMIVPGTIVSKFGPRMKRVYDQMPEPKFVVGMGSCTISGGPFQEATTSSRAPRRSSQSTSTSQAVRLARRHSSTASSNCKNESRTAKRPPSSSNPTNSRSSATCRRTNSYRNSQARSTRMTSSCATTG